MKNILFILFCTCLTFRVAAQLERGDITLRPFIGASTSYPLGSSIKELKSIDDEWESNSTDENSYDGAVLPLYGFHAGGSVSYALSPKFEVGLGLQVARWGHIHREKYTYHDQRYQYDAQLKIKDTYRFRSLSMPITGTWHFSEKWRLAGGISLAWLQSGKTARHASRRQLDVTINGERDAEESEPKRTDEYDLGPRLKKVMPGAFLGLYFPLPKGVQGYLEVHGLHDVFSDKEAKVHYLSARLGVTYPISFQL